MPEKRSPVSVRHDLAAPLCLVTSQSFRTPAWYRPLLYHCFRHTKQAFRSNTPCPRHNYESPYLHLYVPGYMNCLLIYRTPVTFAAGDAYVTPNISFGIELLRRSSERRIWQFHARRRCWLRHVSHLQTTSHTSQSSHSLVELPKANAIGHGYRKVHELPQISRAGNLKHLKQKNPPFKTCAR